MVTPSLEVDPLCGVPTSARGRTVSGGHGGGVTPVPIPNTAVKPVSADGTWGVAPWESRTPPEFLRQQPSALRGAVVAPGGRWCWHRLTHGSGVRGRWFGVRGPWPGVEHGGRLGCLALTTPARAPTAGLVPSPAGRRTPRSRCAPGRWRESPGRPASAGWGRTGGPDPVGSR